MKNCNSFIKKECMFGVEKIDSLLNELEINHGPEEWRSFIDSFKNGLKAFLL